MPAPQSLSPHSSGFTKSPIAQVRPLSFDRLSFDRLASIRGLIFTSLTSLDHQLPQPSPALTTAFDGLG